MEVLKKAVPLDGSYVPLGGDMLSNGDHPLLIIESVYYLDKYSMRVDKNYYEHLSRHELIQELLRRREIIWQQHRLDEKMFPGKIDPVIRATMTYYQYLISHDYARYQRIYYSKYFLKPLRKRRVKIGVKAMVKTNHSWCVRVGTNALPCMFWYGTKAMPVSFLINNNFVYRGNLYTDILGRNIERGQ